MEKGAVHIGLSSDKQPLIHCLRDGDTGIAIGMDLAKGSETDSSPSFVKHFCYSSAQRFNGIILIENIVGQCQ